MPCPSLFRCSFAVLLPLAGCASPYHADQGALLGGAVGAGTGAVVGHALGNTGAGALVGAGVGALTGGAIGAGQDETEARDRALIEQRMAQQPAPGAITVPDVINMTRANVDEGLILNQIHARGLAAGLQAADVIYLQQQGVSKPVIAAMQSSQVSLAGPPPVIVEERGPPGYYYYGRPRYYDPPPIGVGLSFRSR